MSVEKSVRLSDETYRDAALIAKYQHRTFSAYARHCIKLDIKRRIKDAQRSGACRDGESL